MVRYVGDRLDTDEPGWQLLTITGTGSLCYMIYFSCTAHLAPGAADNQTVELYYLQARPFQLAALDHQAAHGDYQARYSPIPQNQCCGSGSKCRSGSTCFWASQIRISILLSSCKIVRKTLILLFCDSF
jgi:hypothetical protein